MTLGHRRWSILGCIGCTLAATAAAIVLSVWQNTPACAGEATATAPATADPALDRAREQVKMLDDLYKNAVVSITETYVDAQEIEPAIMVAKQVFGAMEKQGWHSARLVDATGSPLNKENSPVSDFEKDAAKAIKAGQPYFERVIGEGSNRRLQAATVVPVVMKQCTQCHVNKKMGDVLGFLRYDLPVK
jgi:hypothetical protein